MSGPLQSTLGSYRIVSEIRQVT